MTETPLRSATERQVYGNGASSVPQARLQEQELSNQVYRTDFKDASQDTKLRSGLRRIAEGRLQK